MDQPASAHPPGGHGVPNVQGAVPPGQGAPFGTGAPGAPLGPGDSLDGGGAGGGQQEAALEAFVSGAAYAALALLGAILGLVGSFAQGWTLGTVPAASIALVLVNFGVSRLAGWAMGGRLGAAVPVLVWAPVAFVLSMRRAEGDLIVPGSLPGYLFIIGGLLAGVVAVSLVPASRPSGGWLTWRAPSSTSSTT